MDVFDFRDEDPRQEGFDWEPWIGLGVAAFIFVLAIIGLVTVIRMAV